MLLYGSFTLCEGSAKTYLHSFTKWFFREPKEGFLNLQKRLNIWRSFPNTNIVLLWNCLILLWHRWNWHPLGTSPVLSMKYPPSPVVPWGPMLPQWAHFPLLPPLGNSVPRALCFSFVFFIFWYHVFNICLYPSVNKNKNILFPLMAFPCMTFGDHRTYRDL